MAKDKTLYVADTANHRGLLHELLRHRSDIQHLYLYAVRKISPSGEVTTVAGTGNEWGWKDGQGTRAAVSNPNGLTLDPQGTAYLPLCSIASLAQHQRPDLRFITREHHTAVPTSP